MNLDPRIMEPGGKFQTMLACLIAQILSALWLWLTLGRGLVLLPLTFMLWFKVLFWGAFCDKWRLKDLFYGIW